jgi:hypothetical protein
MGWSRALLFSLAILVAGGGARGDDRTTALARRADELSALRAQLVQKRDATRKALAADEQAIAQSTDRALLETVRARARDEALALRTLDAQLKKLDDDQRALTRERVAVYDGEIDRLQREIDREAARLADSELRRRLTEVSELRRARDRLAATLPQASAHRGSDLAAIVVGAGDAADVLAEKADLAESFARGWRGERDELGRRQGRAREELELVRRLGSLMEARRRGRLGATDPFAADVEAFALRERERQLGAELGELERRIRELSGWIAEAERRRAELLQAFAGKGQP